MDGESVNIAKDQTQFLSSDSTPVQEFASKREGQLSLDEKKFLLSVERGDLASVRRYVSWEAIDRNTATFTPDISPLMLAAHRNNYEIIKILLDRGATLPNPHQARCGCRECVISSSEDSLRHSRFRINAYRALASPSLISLSSKDPILTAFELSWELRRLSFMEQEFKSEYLESNKITETININCVDPLGRSALLMAIDNENLEMLELLIAFGMETKDALLHAISEEYVEAVEVLLEHEENSHKKGDPHFCAHSNVQQLLASIWYEGLPGFRRKNALLQSLEIIRIGILFPLYSIAYILAPHSSFGRTIRRPFIKFICHSISYVTFLFLLILASQRVESVMIGWLGTKPKQKNAMVTKRGASPTIIEWMVLAWVAGLIWSEIKELWESGLTQYISDMWNIIDFFTNSLYVATVALRVVAYFQVQKEISLNTGTAFLPRESWDAWDPILIAEGLFAAANVFSSLKLVYIFSVNPHLGPLQICLGRMVIDILKFFFVYALVLFAFACGMNQLLWYYADLEKQTCQAQRDVSACQKWRRFANVFESSQTLFWASFGLIDLDSFELTNIKSYTRFWGMLMFGSYSVINIVVLLNLLIAMMNHSYQMISEHTDTEWKFARSKLWMSYFEDGGTVPPPFNIIPTPKSVYYLLCWIVRKLCGYSELTKKDNKTNLKKAKKATERDFRYQTIMRSLVRRYVTKEQRYTDNQGVTEDDVNEIKQDISSFRYELMEVLKNSGFNTLIAKGQTQ
ncbi:transient receptor potential-gamma protein-like, partial [Limulus polyphemus]|uniref:Transient receptor potential-gamma protein-like n=1 Tax=Limulus polyphemus TaxID=6850 RepID=A0ABM1STH5_LIMPO